MPELPEVEVVRRGLARWVIGRTVESVDVLHPRPVRRHLPGPDHFADRLTGVTFTDAVRRGKFLWLPLDDGDALLAHLGMSGQLLVSPPSTPAEPDAVERHLRVRLTLRGGGELRFVDQRMFGGLAVVPMIESPDGLPALLPTSLPVPVAHIARDPLDPYFDEPAFISRLRGRHTGVKRALLDQGLISGIGNIYADEALWRAKLHYARPTELLSRPAVTRLLTAVREVMTAALAQGGTSFDSLYVNVNGESGYFDRSLAVYGQQGRPCPRCGALIRREPFMNRSSFSCPRCQPAPRTPHRGAGR